MRKPITGVYRLFNKVTDDSYVGSAFDVPTRIRIHFGAMRRGEAAARLQENYNQYGRDVFDHEVIERHSHRQRKINDAVNAWLQRRERHYVSLLSPSLNCQMFVKRGAKYLRQPRIIPAIDRIEETAGGLLFAVIGSSQPSRAEIYSDLLGSLAALPLRQRWVVESLYGINEELMKIDDIAEILNISRQAVCAISLKAIEKLRGKLAGSALAFIGRPEDENEDPRDQMSLWNTGRLMDARPVSREELDD